MESKDLWVELKPDHPSYMVLKGTYGEKVYRAFGMTRQGVRWRFRRIYNDIYVSAFSTILFIEKTFGTQLRDYAIRISRERYPVALPVSYHQVIGLRGRVVVDPFASQRCLINLRLGQSLRDCLGGGYARSWNAIAQLRPETSPSRR